MYFDTDFIMYLADGLPEVTCLLFDLLNRGYSEALDIMFVLDIIGVEILNLYVYACKRDIDSLVENLYALQIGKFSPEDIHYNLLKVPAILFIDKGLRRRFEALEKTSLPGNSEPILNADTDLDFYLGLQLQIFKRNLTRKLTNNSAK